MANFIQDKFIAVPKTWSPSIPKTSMLLKAIGRHPDFELVECLTSNGAELAELECLVVNVTCDRVPPENNAGINYREMLAIVIYRKGNTVPEVYALREDFPLLMHMNDTPDGYPVSFCLYYEPHSVVLRTWTAQKFLRRIQWWLENSARETIHPADQPAEQLFFSSGHELVLPWNFYSEIQKNGTSACISLASNRPNGGSTYVLKIITSGDTPNNKFIVPMIINTAPVIHGKIERTPRTLNELALTMKIKGVDIVDELRKALIKDVDSTGIPPNRHDDIVLMILCMPIILVDGGPVQKIQIKALFFDSRRLQLGLKVGAYFRGVNDGKYYANHTGTPESEDWESETIYAMDVLHINDPESARRQSGILEAGPKGTLIGAGALGSAMLNIWSRGGWGNWTVIDHDHIKPHNLVRHTAFQMQVGKPKVEAVAELSNEITQGAMTVVPINANATHFDERMISELSNSELVIDASAGLDFPRAASRMDGVGRHVSVFITPDGNSAVMIAEDANRATRLMSLEGQYYREIINSEWGKQHLTGHLGTYYSGASCRDISYALPYSRVMVHAASLSEQIQHVEKNTDSFINVWNRDPSTGKTEFFNIDTFVARNVDLGNIDVLIDQGLEQKLFSMRKEKSPDETGGILLGYFDLTENKLVLVDACSAPSDSASTRTSFQRGIIGTSERVNEVNQLTAGIVGYVGEWHSHPPGCGAVPSTDDIAQLTGLALGMAEDGLPAISLIVSENDINIYQAVRV